MIFRELISTCQGRSQSRGIVKAPTHVPITAPCAGIQTALSTPPLGLHETPPNYYIIKVLKRHQLLSEKLIE